MPTPNKSPVVIRPWKSSLLHGGYQIVTESGADLTRREAGSCGIHVLPMHVAINGRYWEDGAFSVEELLASYQRTGKLPGTSAVCPQQYADLFHALRAQQPRATILHLCYSAATTASWHNALLASEGMEGVMHIDTRQVSAGQGAVALRLAAWLQAYPAAPPEHVLYTAEELIRRARFCFVPNTLDYLRAGGRVSNAQYLSATLTQRKPLIEIADGKLLAARTYCGSMEKIIPRLIGDTLDDGSYSMDDLFLVYSEGLPENLRELAEECCAERGHIVSRWVKTGCVITCHSGPGAFGIGGFVV